MKKKRSLILLLAALLLATAALETFSRLYLSRILRPRVRQGLAEAFGCSTQFAGLRFSLLGGIVVRDIAFHDRSGGTILSARRLRLLPKIPPLFLLRFETKVADFDAPLITFARDEAGKWNIAEVVSYMAKRDEKGGTSLAGVVFNNGRLAVQYAPRTEPKPAARNINMAIWFTPGGKAECRMNAIVPPAAKPNFKVAGTYTPRTCTSADPFSPGLALRISSTMDLKTILELLDTGENVSSANAISGTVQTDFYIKGDTRAGGSNGEDGLEIIGSFKLRDGLIKPRGMPAVKHIAGDIYLINDEFIVKNVKGTCGDYPLSVKGNVSLAAEPLLDITFSSTDSLMSLEGTISRDRLNLKSLSGNIGASTFFIGGTISDFGDPGFDLTYRGKVDLAPMAQKIQEYHGENHLALKLIPKGSLRIDGTIAGKASEPEKITGDLEGSSYSLEMGKWFINSVIFSANMKDSVITVENFAGIINQGTITANGSIDTGLEKTRVSLVSSARGINFREAMSENSEEEIYGTLTGDIKVEGFPSDPSSLTGGGKLLIERGEIWQLNFFKGLQNILGVVQPGIGSIVFDRISGTFSLENSFIDSTDLILDSSSVKLYPKGRLGLDGTLDCVMDVQLFTTRGSLIKKVTGTIMNISGQLVGVKLTGTLKEPRWRPVMLPFFKEIEKTGRRGGRFLKKALPGKPE